MILLWKMMVDDFFNGSGISYNDTDNQCTTVVICSGDNYSKASYFYHQYLHKTLNEDVL